MFWQLSYYAFQNESTTGDADFCRPTHLGGDIENELIDPPRTGSEMIEGVQWRVKTFLLDSRQRLVGVLVITIEPDDGSVAEDAAIDGGVDPRHRR